MRILLTGASGFLGFHLIQSKPAQHSVLGLHHGHRPGSVNSEPIDLADLEAIRSIMAEFRPQAIVHAAAITSVAECEKDPARAHAVNVTGTQNIAALCREFGAHLVHVSTDMVFDGEKDGFYREEDKPNPVTVYARTKLEGEKAVASTCPTATVLRPTLMLGWGPEGKGFLFWMTQQVRESRKMRLFSDQYRTPVSVDDVAAAIWHFVDRRKPGLFHLGGPERIDRVELGKKFLGFLNVSAEIVEPITVSQANLGYAIQKNLSLDSGKIHAEMKQPFAGVDQILEAAAINAKRIL